MIRVSLPAHLRTLAKVGSEVRLEVKGEASVGTVLDELERQYPMLRGTIRHALSKERRPLVRYYACQEDISHEPTDAALPERIVKGEEPLLIIGSIAGG